MVESAQDRHGHNWPIPGVGWQNGGRWIRNLLVQSLMWSCLIKVGNVGLEDAEEVLFMEDQQMIKAFPAYAPQEAFTVRIGTWSVEWCLEHLGVGTAGDTRKKRTELCIVITDEESRGLSIRGGFSELLSNPGIGGMAGHPNMDDFSALQLDDEEGEE